MRCNKCGAQIDDDSKFCSHCGSEVHFVRSQGGFGSRTSPRRKSSVIKVALSLCVFAVVMCFGYCHFSQHESPLMSQCNFNNGGEFAYDKDHVYFISDKYTGDKALYSMRYDESDISQIFESKRITNFRLYKNLIVYCETNDYTYHIGTMEKDGINKKTIIDLDKVALLRKYEIINDSLYYIYKSNLNRCSIDGNNDIVLKTDVKDFAICNGNLFYCDLKDTIYSCSVDKNGALHDERKLATRKGSRNDSRTNILVADQNGVYFTDESGMFYLQNSGSIEQLVDGNNVSSYLIDSDKTYILDMLSWDEIVLLSQSLAQGVDLYYDALTSKFSGCGRLKRVRDGEIEEVDTMPMYMYTIYGYPDGIFCRESSRDHTVNQLM